MLESSAAAGRRGELGVEIGLSRSMAGSGCWIAAGGGGFIIGLTVCFGCRGGTGWSRPRRHRIGPGDDRRDSYEGSPCSHPWLEASAGSSLGEHSKWSGPLELTAGFDCFRKAWRRRGARRRWRRRSICPLCEISPANPAGSTREPDTSRCRHLAMLARSSRGLHQRSCRGRNQLFWLHHDGI